MQIITCLCPRLALRRSKQFKFRSHKSTLAWLPHPLDVIQQPLCVSIVAHQPVLVLLDYIPSGARISTEHTAHTHVVFSLLTRRCAARSYSRCC